MANETATKGSDSNKNSNNSGSGHNVSNNSNGASSSSKNSRSAAERSKQSAKECRVRKKMRYQYLEEMVNCRERAVVELREELRELRKLAVCLDAGVAPPEAAAYLASIERKLMELNILPSSSSSSDISRVSASATTSTAQPESSRPTINHTESSNLVQPSRSELCEASNVITTVAKDPEIFINLSLPDEDVNSPNYDSSSAAALLAAVESNVLLLQQQQELQQTGNDCRQSDINCLPPVDDDNVEDWMPNLGFEQWSL